MRQICFKFADQELIVRLRESPTAEAIYAALPFSARVQTWGQEVYFSAPVSVALEAEAKDVVDAGEIAFWTEGACIAIGFGRTPVSQGNEIRLAARTNIWADATTPVSRLAEVKPGETVQVLALDRFV